jgi:hypothetical protein
MIVPLAPEGVSLLVNMGLAQQKKMERVNRW